MLTFPENRLFLNLYLLNLVLKINNDSPIYVFTDFKNSITFRNVSLNSEEIIKIGLRVQKLYPIFQSISLKPL